MPLSTGTTVNRSPLCALSPHHSETRTITVNPNGDERGMPSADVRQVSCAAPREMPLGAVANDAGYLPTAFINSARVCGAAEACTLM